MPRVRYGRTRNLCYNSFAFLFSLCWGSFCGCDDAVQAVCSVKAATSAIAARGAAADAILRYLRPLLLRRRLRSRQVQLLLRRLLCGLLLMLLLQVL